MIELQMCTDKLSNIRATAHHTAARHRSLRWGHGTARASKHTSAQIHKVRTRVTTMRAPRTLTAPPARAKRPKCPKVDDVDQSAAREPNGPARRATAQGSCPLHRSSDPHRRQYLKRACTRAVQTAGSLCAIAAPPRTPTQTLNP